MSDYIEEGFDLGDFDPGMLSPDEFTTYLDDLDNMPRLIGQEEQEPALDFSLLPDATAAPMEQIFTSSTGNQQFQLALSTTFSIPMISEAYIGRQITNPEEHGAFEASREPATQLEQSACSVSGEADPVAPDHYPVPRPSKFSCIECNASFPRQAALNKHAFTSQHNPFECSCGQIFSRPDALNRHCDSFRKDNRSYPCKFCKRHRDKKAFGRRDHLVQHLRGYHKFEKEEIEKTYPKDHRSRGSYHAYLLACPYAGCEHYRGEKFNELFWSTADFPFKGHSDYKKHLKDVHEITLFPCHVAGCDRVGRRGYSREKDLMKHLTSQHPDAAEYLPAPRKRTDSCCNDCGQYCSSEIVLRFHICIPNVKGKAREGTQGELSDLPGLTELSHGRDSCTLRTEDMLTSE